MTRNEYEKIMEVVSALINERLGGLPLNQGIAPHVFELSYMYGKNGGTPLDHSTFRNFLRKVVPIVTDTIGKDGDVLVFDKNMGGGKWDSTIKETIHFMKWFLLDYTNETLITALPYIDEEGNPITDKTNEELLGRYLYNHQTGEFLQFREDKDGKIYLSTPSIRDNQIVYLENMPTIEETIYYTKDGKLIPYINESVKDVLVGGESLKENGIVNIPIATNDSLGVVKGGENVVIGTDGSINVDVPVSIDEVVNLRSITTEPTTANEGDCYYNATTTLIHYYIDGTWGEGQEPQKSKVYFYEDGTTIHQYRSDGNVLIEIKDTIDIANTTKAGIVKGGGNVDIASDGTLSVSFDEIEERIEGIEQQIPEIKEYNVATKTELGLVKASADNNTAEAQATDGNVQVSAGGKMRVKKIATKEDVGTDSFKFVVNPDETIENLKVGEWVKRTELILGQRLLGSGTFDIDADGFICELYTTALQNTLVEGASLSMNIGNSSGLQGSERSIFCKADSLMNPVYHCTESISTYHTALVVKDVYGNIVFDSDANGDTLYIESFKKDMLPLSLYAVRKAEIRQKQYNADKDESESNMETLKSYSYSYSVKSAKQIIKTTIGGNNIVLGKNGLLIEGAEGEAYVKVLEDGTIEHTFGGTQNTGQANVIEQVKVNDVALPINNKAVNVKIAQNGELIEPNAEGVIDIDGVNKSNKINTKVYSLRNYPDNDIIIYCLEDPVDKGVGFVLYEDKECTKVYGTIIRRQSGTIYLDKDPSVMWALNGSEEYISQNKVTTEYAVYNATTTPVVRIDSATYVELSPNTRTIIEEPIETLNISFGGSSTSIVEEYSLVFVASEGTQLIFANEIQWANATAPTFVGGKTYEINVIDNLALFISY